MTIPQYQPSDWFETVPQTVNSSSSWVLVATLSLRQVYSEGLLTLSVGSGGAIAGLRFTRAVFEGGHHVDWHVDGEFNSPSHDFPSTQPINIHQLPASGSGNIKLGDLGGVGEINVYAKKASADTVLGITGSLVAAR